MSEIKADLILKNGLIYTVDTSNSWVEAAACAEGRILAVGKYSDLICLADENTRVVDLSGLLVLPGFIDSHVHFLWYAMQKRQNQVDLAGVSDLRVLSDRLRKAVRIAPPEDWIHGWGWDETGWEDPPSLSILDEAAPNNPVALRRKDLHTWWVNSKALNLAGITRDTKNPSGSRFGRDAEGELTGILHEWGAIELIEAHIPEADEANIYKMCIETIAEAHRLGITAISDQRLQNEGTKSLHAFLSLVKMGKLELRVCMNVNESLIPEINRFSGIPDDFLWLGAFKVFADGTMGARTAWMLESYNGEQHNFGISVTPVDKIRELAILAQSYKLPLSVHAIGDRSSREVINIMRDIPVRCDAELESLSHRIEHVQLIHPSDVCRLSGHNIFASVQPVHILYDWKIADQVWGDRSRYAYAFRTLLDANTKLAFGSDAPFAPLNPLLGIYAAVTRQDEQGEPVQGWYSEQKLSVAEAVRGYTLAAAEFLGKQKSLGSIAPGKLADFIVLDKNIFTNNPEEIKNSHVVMTIFNGRIVFDDLS